MRNPQITTLEEGIILMQKNYESLTPSNPYAQIILKRIGTLQNALNVLLEEEKKDPEKFINDYVKGIEHQHTETELPENIRRGLDALPTDELGGFSDEISWTWRNNEPTMADAISNHKRIYDKVISLNSNTQAHIHKLSYGPVNKNIQTKIFEVIFPLMLQDMENQNVVGYVPNIEYVVENIDTANQKAVMVINTQTGLTISEWDGNEPAIERDENGKEIINFSEKIIKLDGMKLDLSDFISNINFKQLSLSDIDKQKYISAIQKVVPLDKVEDANTVTERINSEDITDYYNLNKGLHDSQKIALTLYTRSSVVTNRVMYGCNNLHHNELNEFTNQALTSVAIASEAITNFTTNNKYSYVQRAESGPDKNKARFDELVESENQGKVIVTKSLFSTSPHSNGRIAADVWLFLKDMPGIFLEPLTKYKGEKELLVSASQQILLESYAQTTDQHKYHVFVGKAVNVPLDFIPIENNNDAVAEAILLQLNNITAMSKDIDNTPNSYEENVNNVTLENAVAAVRNAKIASDLLAKAKLIEKNLDEEVKTNNMSNSLEKNADRESEVMINLKLTVTDIITNIEETANKANLVAKAFVHNVVDKNPEEAVKFASEKVVATQFILEKAKISAEEAFIASKNIDRVEINSLDLKDPNNAELIDSKDKADELSYHAANEYANAETLHNDYAIFERSVIDVIGDVDYLVQH